LSAAEDYYCLRNFRGPDGDGGVVDYVYGDLVPKVTTWPTFKSLKNIDWISATKPVDLPGDKKAKVLTLPKGVTVDPKKVAKKKSPAKKKAAKRKKSKTVKAKGGSVSCPQCDRTFASSRSMKVHERYHASDG